MGILDQIFGAPGSDQSQAMGLLAAGLVKGDFGGGLLAANNVFSPDVRMKRELMQAQVDETRAQALARQQALKNDQEFSDWMKQKMQAGQASAGATNFGVGMPANGATMQSDSYRPAQPGSWLLGLSPEDQFYMKLRGKDPVDIIKANRPDMQVSNGYAFDKNKVQPGFLPQLNQSQSGQTSMVQIGHDGMPVVSAPSGAENTFARYQNIEQSAKANFEPITVQPQGQAPQMTTRGALVRNPQVSGLDNSGEAERTRILTAELGAAQGRLQAVQGTANPDVIRRAQADVDGITKELKRQGASVGMPLQSEAEKAKAETLSRGEAERSNEAQTKGIQFSDFRDQARIARDLLTLDPTHSGPGAAIDATANFFGHATSGGKVANQLDLIGSWMTQNVPKAPGAQSNYELTQYQQAAGQVGNRTAPIENRLAALSTLESLIGTWEKRRATGAATPNEPAGSRYSSGKVGEATALPANPSAMTLKKNTAYQLPDGRTGVWDGVGFKVQ